MYVGYKLIKQQVFHSITAGNRGYASDLHSVPYGGTMVTNRYTVSSKKTNSSEKYTCLKSEPHQYNPITSMSLIINNIMSSFI